MARKSRKTNPAQTEQTPIKVNRTGVYIRRSVYDDGHDDNSPIENQKEFVITKLADFPDVNIEKIYVDNGFTGTNFDRDAWQELIYDMQTGKINCIAVRDLSRIGRNFLETGNYLERVFPFLNIRVISINDKYDSSRDDYNKAMLERCYKNLMHEFYSVDISTKVTTGLKAKRSMGQAVMSSIPYGYTRDKEKMCLIPDTETAHIVTKIFTMRANGKRICEIREYLNKLLIPSPGRYKYMRSGGKKHISHKDSVWTDDMIQSILRNETYTGKLIQHKTTRSVFRGGKTEYIDRSEWDITENAHTPLVSPEVYAKIASIPKQKFLKGKAQNYLIRKVRCGKCRCIMQKVKRKYDPVWQCYSHNDKLKDNCDLRVRLSNIRNIVKTTLALHIQLISDKSTMLENILGSKQIQAKLKQCSILMTAKQNELNEIKHSLAELYEDYKDGIMTADEYEYAKRSYTEKQSQKQDELASLYKTNVSFLNTKALVKRLKNLIEETITEDADDEKLFSYVDEIVVYSKERLEIRFSFSDIFEEIKLAENGLEAEI